jgi:hypothetical protein
VYPPFFCLALDLQTPSTTPAPQDESQPQRI